ncbi:MAG: hypothetical protein DSZ27_08450 [Thiomicrospira sp.]|nr:MAG: hypothetical protein DSZ27_08450 [Thiomicrospira sp.]
MKDSSLLRNVAAKLRDMVFIWGTLSAIFIWAAKYYEGCEDCFGLYQVEMGLAVLTVVTSMIIWFVFTHKIERVNVKVEDGLKSVHIALLKSDVDRFYKDHKGDEFLIEDDAKYLYMLKDKLGYYGVNSFTQRKVDFLLQKDIR